MDRTPTRVRWLPLVSIAILFSALAGCSLASPSPSASPGEGHLAGGVYLRGSTVKDAPIEVTLTIKQKSDPSRSYTTDSDSNGSFGIDLPPGGYDITGILKSNGRGETSPDSVVVQAGATTTVKLFVTQP